MFLTFKERVNKKFKEDFLKWQKNIMKEPNLTLTLVL